MLRKMIVGIVAATTLGVALAPADAVASRGKWRGAGFHGAAVYYPDVYAPFYAGGAIYCWHWFRAGRGWGRAWAC
jgi:hypothetical protein